MKIQLTYGLLHKAEKDIQFHERNCTAFFLFNIQRFDRFRTANAISLKILHSRMDEFVKKFVRMDKNNQPITEVKEGQTIYTFYNKEAEDAYVSALNHFFSLKITVEV